MSLLMRDLSPFELQEEILKLLLNQHMGQQGRQPHPYLPGAAHGHDPLAAITHGAAAFAPMLRGDPYAANPIVEMASSGLPGFGGASLPTGFPGRGSGDMSGQREAVPALFDPDEDEMPNNQFDACRDRCYQQLRRDVLDCYKKRGARAKALCFAVANARYGTCLGACVKYRK